MLDGLIVVFSLIIIMLILWKISTKCVKKLSIRARKIWLAIHVFTAIIYFSGLIGIILLHIFSLSFPLEELPIFLQLEHAFDYYLIVVGGMLTILSGIWLSLRSGLGLIVHYWIIVKWLGSFIVVITGVALIGNSISIYIPKAIISDTLSQANFMFVLGQIICMTLMIIIFTISYIKPKGRLKHKITSS